MKYTALECIEKYLGINEEELVKEKETNSKSIMKFFGTFFTILKTDIGEIRKLKDWFFNMVLAPSFMG
ncbi:MAG: hypothetical protein COB09_19480 [Thalassobium sp.]|nr:MAG: hypothetical protein COB09_19480 [Thalassobium sp.]